MAADAAAVGRHCAAAVAVETAVVEVHLSVVGLATHQLYCLVHLVVQELVPAGGFEFRQTFGA
jgi:hypothetical protein